MYLDNLVCVFILGGVVPNFATGNKRWGEFVTGGSPNPALQSMACELFQLQLDNGFDLRRFGPRESSTRAPITYRACPRCVTTATASGQQSSDCSTPGKALSRLIGLLPSRTG